MNAPDILKIPSAYDDPDGHDKATAVLQTDAWLSLDMAMMGHYEVTKAILSDWALHCREVYGSRATRTESGLVMTIKGVSFLEAFLVMELMEIDWNKGIFPPWVRTVYRPCAAAEQGWGLENNRATWGILGCILADKILGYDPTPWIDRIDRNFKAAISDDGKMKIEIERTNMGMWYSAFALSALLRSCQLVNHPRIDALLKPLWWLWQYVKDPLSWPYLPGQGIWHFFPNLERKIHPTTDELEILRANDLGGSLYLAAGRQWGIQEWIDYARPWPADPPFPGVNVFRWQR